MSGGREADRVRLLDRFGACPERELDVVQALREGRDVVLAGGSELGKSSLVLKQAFLSREEGFAAVVAPLRAQCLDQVEQCAAQRIPALHFSSTKPWAKTGSAAFFNTEKATVLPFLRGSGAAHQHAKLVFFSPDRMADEDVLAALGQACRSGRLKLLVVDDAQYWLPKVQEYRRGISVLVQRGLKRLFPGIPLLALGAPATPADLVLIRDMLRLSPDALEINLSLHKSNISLEVRTPEAVAARRVGTEGKGSCCTPSSVPADGYFWQLEDAVRLINSFKVKGRLQPGLVFCRLKDTCEAVAAALGSEGIKAFAFHADVNMGLRSELWRRWKAGDIVLVCSVAFGVGVHKPDVRWVVHWDLPANTYGLYSEIARAGRDGKPAHSVLFASRTDLEKVRNWHRQEGAPYNAQNAAALEQYAFGAPCRRTALFGATRCKLADRDQLCDLCSEDFLSMAVSQLQFNKLRV